MIDQVWDRLFGERDWGRYPNEDLVRFVMRAFGRLTDRSAVKALEVGCAEANNIWFLAREGFDAVGIDGSPKAIEKGRRRLEREGTPATLEVVDATCLADAFAPETFDLVIDVGCLQCNRLSDIVSIVDQMHRVSKVGGRMFSLVVTDEAVGNGRGTQVEPGTFFDIDSGPLIGTGLNHFFSLSDVRTAFAPFAPLSIELVTRSLAEREMTYCTWVVTGSKIA